MIDEGQDSFVALYPHPLMDGEACAHCLEAEEAEQLAIELIRAAAKVRALRGEG